jgi:hypothetical protein
METLFDIKIDRRDEIKIPLSYKVERLQTKIAKEYIHKNHYSHGSHNAPSPCYGLFDGYDLIGVIMFATPCSENVRASVFGKDRKDEVIELHRLHVLDITPRMTEGWFIGKSIKLLKKDRSKTKAIISFADTTQGHEGVIYKATNFMFMGKTSKATFYEDVDGRLRHPRQNGVNITLDEATKRGWKAVKREAKNRYILYL